MDARPGEKLMKKFIATGLASLTLVSIAVPATTTPAEARRGAGLFAGAIIGLSAAAIIANSSRVSAAEHRGWRYRCDRWAHRCNRGDDRACYAFDDECRG
jgi:hypothetical protein